MGTSVSCANIVMILRSRGDVHVCQYLLIFLFIFFRPVAPQIHKFPHTLLLMFYNLHLENVKDSMALLLSHPFKTPQN